MTKLSSMDASLPSRAGLRLLLVEDNPGDADLIQARLRVGDAAGCTVCWVDRLSTAADELRAGQVDAVLLDLNLPDSEGIDTVLRTRKAAPLVPIVVLTGNVDHEMGLAAVHAGAQEFLAKGEATADLLWRVLRYAIERQRAQEHVRESEQFLQASLDALSGCVAILDANGMALFVNQPWATFLGRADPQPEQCLGVDYLAVLDEAAALGSEDSATLAAGARAVLAGELPEFEMEFRNEAPREGTWLLIRITRFPGAGPVRIAVIHDDITSVKRAELREARLADVLRGVRSVNQLITRETDPQRLIQSACDTLVGALSYRSAWVLLLDGPEGCPLVGTAGAAQQVADFAEQLRNRQWPACVARGLAEPGLAVVSDVAAECPDCFLTGLQAGDRLVARLEDHGQAVGVIGVLTPLGLSVDTEERDLFAELAEDVAFALNKIRLEAEHLASQRALVRSEERYRALFENAPVGIFETTLGGEAVAANPAMGEILGFDSAAEMTEHYRDLGAQLYADPGRRADFVRLLKRDGEVQNFEYEAYRRDGHRLWLSMNARVHTPVQGGEARIEGYTRDITQRREAEAKLVESERLYRLLADNTTDSIWLMDVDANFEYLNPACQGLLGYTPEEMVGTNLAEYCSQEALAEMAAAMRGGLASLPQRGPIVFESTMLRRDGSSVPVENTGRVVVDGDGNPIALQGVTRDITERLRATEELRASENLLSKIIDVLPVGLWLADGDGELFRTNPAGARIWGASSFVGTEEYGVFKARRLPSREEIAPDDWALAHTLRDKVSIFNELLEIDAFDGETRTILNSTAPVLNDAGEIDAVVVVNHDVTDLQRTQAERIRLLLAIEQSHETIVITDADGVIEYANPAFEATTGYSAGESVGLNPRFLKSGQQDKAFYEELWNTISRGAPWRGRFVNRRKDGELYTEDASISPVMDEGGRIVNYVAVKRDISEELRIQAEKAELEAQVEQNNRLESIGRLAGGVAHDLNNLLSPILGYGELLMLDLEDNEEQCESAREIVRASERARDLVAQLLAFSRRQVLDFQSIDVNDVVSSFESLLRRTIREDVEMKLFLEPGLPSVRADVGQLEQVMMNLGVNAQHAMPDGGSLVIETLSVELGEEYAETHPEVTPGRHVLLSVSDTGCGMDQETCAHIFDPFFTTKSPEEGTGLGLATVYGIVKQHSGSIWVYSEPGSGTTFKIYLPVDPDAVVVQGESPERALETGGDETVLLVEDDDQVRALARTVLERDGYAVLVAAGGEHARQLLAEHAGPLDLLLTDVIMPDTNGRQLYEQLASARPELKVLYMSGYTGNVIAHHGILDAGLNFIQKPFTVQGLAQKVREVLDG